MKILIPKHKYEIPFGSKVFFLAGPVRGADDWQRVCAEKLGELLADCYVAIPYYHTKEVKYPLMDIAERGTGEEFPRQQDWERYYLDVASTSGSIIFWLPEESKTNPRADGQYARDTRGEIGEWRGRLMANPILKVAVGGEEGFSGFDQIMRNFKSAVGQNFPIYSTLDETVAAAVEHATRKVLP